MVTTGADAPVLLGPNTVPSFYPGTGRIGELRNDRAVPTTDPEDWIASTARRTGMGDRGLTTLPDGTRLLERIAHEPDVWLGPGRDHNGLLIKLLDAGARLPLHVHPSRDFATEHLGSPHGKTEAWIVLHAEPDAFVHLGFRRDVTTAELHEWVSTQDRDAILGHTNRVLVTSGDVLLCPAGVPHAIGAGVFVIELQEATDYSIMLEWDGYPIDPEDVFLGLDATTALSAADRTGYDDRRLAELRGDSVQTLAEAAPGVHRLLPPAAEPFFGAEQLRPIASGASLGQAFAVLIVLEGHGHLTGDRFTPLDVNAGETWLVPYDAGPTTLTGDVLAIRCHAA